MYGAGTGILIRMKDRFFVLTPHHVIRKNTLGAFQNESPFWINSTHPPRWEFPHGFLFPRRLYEIGSLIEDDGSWTLNVTDVVLIELFLPVPPIYPSSFIDLDAGDAAVVEKAQFFEGQLLLVNGYPHNINGFQHYDEKVGEFTHSTDIRRHSIVGICLLENGEPVASLEMTRGSNEPADLDGMSGAVVSNVDFETSSVKWAGMALTAGSKLIRFIPAYLLVPAIRRHTELTPITIDPASDIPSREPTDDELREYREMFREFPQ